MSAIAAIKKPTNFCCQRGTRTVRLGGLSNPVPGGSARKSAAIIPFVNESLTSGLPIASVRNWYDPTRDLAMPAREAYRSDIRHAARRHGNTVRRAGRLWEIEVAARLGCSGMTLAIDGRAVSGI